MYYFAREGFQETSISEGFCKELVYVSEMLNGVIKIDGHTVIPMEMGERFKLTMDPSNDLRQMRFTLLN